MNLNKQAEKANWIENYVCTELDKVNQLVDQHEFLTEYVDWTRLEKSYYKLAELAWEEYEVERCLG